MDRRSFVKTAAAGALATALLLQLASPAAAAATGPVRRYSGADLAGWENALGDGWASPGRSTVQPTDVETNHYGDHSELRANIRRRGIMAHQISFKRIIDQAALTHVHVGRFEFRLPFEPVPRGWPDNAQTIEGGLFVWDGGNTRLDYGLAFQWLLNPWMSNAGDVHSWSQSNGGSWAPATALPPDQAWHQVEFVLDMKSEAAAMTIDGADVPASFVAEQKQGWGTETAARLQAEIISIWPGKNGRTASHRAQFRNWSWEWFA